MFLIKQIVKENRKTLNFMTKKMQKGTPLVKVDPDMNKDLEQLTRKFPLICVEDLEEVEVKLSDPETMNAAAIHLSLIGGDSVKDITSKLMYYVLSNRLGSYYSWEGQKGKQVFKKLKLATLIIKSVRIRKQNAIESDIIKRIKGWLVQAKFRETLKYKKADNREIDVEFF